ncbi:MAG TPA: MinD/ParA family protein, partial [Pseudonocardia sp.]|nr:MinD/ParA family protein [Pseudonocardia sp.]
EEYERVCRALARYFDIVITDSGTGLVHSTMRGTLELADRLIVVGSPTVDGASRASKTLDWLLAHGHERLVEDAVLVLCQDRGSHRVDHAQLYQHFAERCRHVIEIPADQHLYSGAVIDPAMLQPATRQAYLQLAAVVADGFSAAPALLPAGR